MQLTELKSYIKNISICMGIVNILSKRRQDHKCYTLIKCATILTSKLSKTYNYIHQYYITIPTPEKYISPIKTLLLIMSPFINTQSLSTENITIYNESTTIPTSL